MPLDQFQQVKDALSLFDIEIVRLVMPLFVNFGIVAEDF
jgi:hypothetical protein